MREGVKEDVIRNRLATIVESSELSQIDETTAIESGKAYIEIEENAKKSKSKRPSFFEPIVLATARVNEAKVLTGDLHFRAQPETVWLK